MGARKKIAFLAEVSAKTLTPFPSAIASLWTFLFYIYIYIFFWAQKIPKWKKNAFFRGYGIDSPSPLSGNFGYECNFLKVLP